MKRKIWGIVAIVSTLLLWLWIMIALPSFKGFEGADASSARVIILWAFTILAFISIISGIFVLILSREKKS